MTIDEMRAALGLGPGVPDIDVLEAYVASLGDIVVNPPSPIVTLDDVKGQIRVFDDSEDAFLSSLIVDAQDWIERYTGLVLSVRTVTEQFDSFDRLQLKAWPIAPDAEVTITYLNVSGVDEILAGYRLLSASRPARILPAMGSTWPRHYRAAGSVTLSFTAGFASAQSLPPALRRAVLVMIAGWYADREGGPVARAAEASAAAILDRANLRLRVL